MPKRQNKYHAYMNFAILTKYPCVCSAIQYIHVSTFIQYALGGGEGVRKKSTLCTLAKKAENCGLPITVQYTILLSNICMMEPHYYDGGNKIWGKIGCSILLIKNKYVVLIT